MDSMKKFLNTWNYFWSVIISKRNTGHEAMNLSKEQRRILKLKNSHLYTKLLQNIHSAMSIQKLSPALPPLLLLKEFLTSLALTATKTKPFLYTVKSPAVGLIETEIELFQKGEKRFSLFLSQHPPPFFLCVFLMWLWHVEIWYC